MGISVHAPIRIATDTSIFAMPETGIGFFTDVGASYFLPRIMSNNLSLGLYLGLTNMRLKAKKLVQWCIATHYVPLERMDNLRKDIVEVSKVKPEVSEEELRSIVSMHSDKKVQTGQIKDLDEIMQIFKDDSIQAIYDRIMNGSTPFCHKLQKRINSLSPLSMAVIFEELKRGRNMNMKEVFEMEYKLS